MRYENEMHTIDDLPLTKEQKELVLEWYARKIVEVEIFVTGETPCAKAYDPLVISGDVAHSYAFDLNTGGRHHEFESLAQLEELLTREMKIIIAEEYKVPRRCPVCHEVDQWSFDFGVYKCQCGFEDDLL